MPDYRVRGGPVLLASPFSSAAHTLQVRAFSSAPTLASLGLFPLLGPAFLVLVPALTP